MCIAADSGLDHAHDLGLVPQVVVGDLDSVSRAALARARADGATIDRYPARKAKTDLELALDRAVAAGPDRIVVAGIGGGRLDHHLANLLVLADDRYRGTDIDALNDTARVVVVRSRPRTFHGRAGESLTLLAVHGDAGDVVTTGLAYPLWGETLHAGSTRGVSNELVTTTASVTVGRGVVLAVQPYGLGGSEPGGNEGGSAEA
jgi:thiamine pyrophosphokinase